MATIPSKPQSEFIADSNDGDVDDRYVVRVKADNGRIMIDVAGIQGCVYITREQAMAFFDLIPRPECTCNGIGTHCDLHPQ